MLKKAEPNGEPKRGAMPERIERAAAVAERHGGMRLDQAAAELFPEFSRSRLQAWIRGGELTLNGKPARPRHKVAAGEALQLQAAPGLPAAGDSAAWVAEDIPLSILHEDDDLIVLNKPAGLVAHPAAGHPTGTLVNALLRTYPELAQLPRAGIVHRLDRGTSGLLAVARSLRGHAALAAQIQSRAAGREYVAVCAGALTGGGEVNAPIGRHPKHRQKMAVVASGGKPARTIYRLRERFAHYTALDVRLETGRTHQIRVHLAHIRHPLIGDPQYGGRLQLPPAAAPELADALRGFPRQALHARALALKHPVTGADCRWESEIPSDMAELLRILRRFDSE